MSGEETMRRAATRMRHDVDFGQAYGDPTFVLAVADWLDATADRVGGKTWTGSKRAVAVARAYLSEPTS